MVVCMFASEWGNHDCNAVFTYNFPENDYIRTCTRGSHAHVAVMHIDTYDHHPQAYTYALAHERPVHAPMYKLITQFHADADVYQTIYSHADRILTCHSRTLRLPQINLLIACEP